MTAESVVSGLTTVPQTSELIPDVHKVLLALAVQGRLRAEGEDESQRDQWRKRVAQRTGDGGAMVPLTKDELPSGFPESTDKYVRLGWIATIEKGRTPIKQARAGPFKLIATAVEPLPCDHYDFDENAAIVPLVSSAGHGKASLQRLHWGEAPYALGTILAAVCPRDPELFSARFLYEYLKAFKNELLVSRMLGTANVTLTTSKLADVPVPLVTPAVQRTVERLCRVCEDLGEASDHRERLRDALVQTVQRRAATAATREEAQEEGRTLSRHLPVLTVRSEHIPAMRDALYSLAVRGLLVPQVESDTFGKDALVENDAVRREVAEHDPRADREAQALLGAEERWDVPETWRWRALADVALFIDYRGKTPTKVDDGVRLITAKNVKKGVITDAPAEFISLSAYDAWMTRGLPRIGDVLFTTEAPLGNAAVVASSERFALAQRIICLRSYGAITPEFLMIELLSAPFRAILENAATGLTAKGIKAAKLKRLPIAIPPIAEQQRVVAKLHEVGLLSAQLDEQLRRTSQLAKALISTALTDAMRRSDPSDGNALDLV